MSDPPGRETRAAESGRRWSWAGHAERTLVEKRGFGRFVDDLAYVFAEISVLALPVLYHLLTSDDLGHFGVKSAALVTLLTMVGGGALIATAGLKLGSVLLAFALGGLTIGLFPRLAESVARLTG